MTEELQPKIIEKRSARGLVRDGEGRLLLLKWRDPTNGREVWEVPGGGIEGEETLEEALIRELREESGYIDIRVGPPVWKRKHTFTWAGQKYAADEVFFLCELLSEARVDPSRDEIETAGFVEARWWHPSDLPSEDYGFIPPDLGLILSSFREWQ